MLALVTATRNSMGTLHESLQSISDIRDRVQHIFIDGNSTDGTLEYMHDYMSANKRTVLINQDEPGLYQALNQGVRMAMAMDHVDYIGLLHSDDNVIPSSFAEYLSKIEASNVPIHYSDIQYHNSAGDICRSWRAGAFSDFKFKTGWMPPHTSMIVSKRVYASVGLYKPEYSTAADYEWIVRVLSESEKNIEYFPKKTVSMRTGGASNVSLAARIRANAMDGNAWRQKSWLHVAAIRVLKPLRKVGQFVNV